MSRRVDFYFEFSSPYSYLAATQIGDLCRRQGAELVWKPILLGPIFRAIGKKSAVDVPATAPYAHADLERCAKRLGVPFRFSDHFPLHTVAASRGVHYARGKRCEERYVLAMFRACWVENLDPSREETLRQVAVEAGLKPEELLAHTRDPEVKAWLHREMDAAQKLGLFGAPIMIFDGEWFHGQDRLTHLEDALASSRLPRAQEPHLSFAHTAFDRLLGSQCVLWEDGKTRYELELEERHLNKRGVAHGGVVASMLDTALGAAVVSAIPKQEWCGTLELSIQFREPVRPGKMVAEGRVARRGQRVAFSEGEVRDAKGKILATAHGVWTIWPSRPE